MNKNPAPKQNRTHIVRARLNDDEYKRLMDWCKALEKTPSYMIRSALTSAAIHPVVYVNGINEQTLTLLNNLITEGKRIGNNINQIAHVANMTGLDDPYLIERLNKALGELTEWRNKILEKAGESIGNHQAYKF